MTDQNVYVLGHKSPDTDSICSAIVYAFFKKKELKENVIPARAGELNDETKYVLKKFGVESPISVSSAKGKRLILVDHNEIAQMLEDINEAEEVFEVVDHHRLADLQTSKPILMRLEPVGSTCTILTEMFLYHKTELPKNIAGLLLSGILSDTIIFKSPTTTQRDKDMAEQLGKILGIDITTYGIEMKKAGADFAGRPLSYSLTKDKKVFTLGNTKLAIAQFELVDIAEVAQKRKEILSEMEKMRKQEGVSLFIFMATDIIKEGTELFVVGENAQKIIKDVFKKDLKEGSVWIDGMLSRKKQAVPPLEQYFAKK